MDNKVVIIGSRLNATPIPAKKCYAANDAAFLNYQCASVCRSLHIVYSSSVLEERYGPKQSCNSKKHSPCFEGKALQCHNLERIVFWRYSKEPMVGYSNLIAKETIVERFNSQRCHNIVEKSSKLREPIIIPAHGGWSKRSLDAIDFIKSFMSARLSDSYNVRGKFRVSTGVAALCLAVLENGKDSDYIITGFDFSEPQRVEANRQYIVGRKHLYADRKVVEALKKRVRLSTTEVSLAKLGIPLV